MIYLFLTMFWPNLLSYTDTECRVYWKNDFKLQWKHYTSEKDTSILLTSGGFADAISVIGIEYLECTEQKKLVVRPYLNTCKSWVWFPTSDLLKHEQLHFDIAELFARKINELFENANIQVYNDLASNIYSNNVQSWRSMVDAYDSETSHGTLLEKQHYWGDSIQNLLNDTQEYSSDQFVGCINLN